MPRGTAVVQGYAKICLPQRPNGDSCFNWPTTASQNRAPIKRRGLDDLVEAGARRRTIPAQPRPSLPFHLGALARDFPTGLAEIAAARPPCSRHGRAVGRARRGLGRSAGAEISNAALAGSASKWLAPPRAVPSRLAKSQWPAVKGSVQRGVSRRRRGLGAMSSAVISVWECPRPRVGRSDFGGAGDGDGAGRRLLGGSPCRGGGGRRRRVSDAAPARHLFVIGFPVVQEFPVWS